MGMTLFTRLLVYPDGDTQEIPHDLRMNEVVDLNGFPLPLPLPTDRMIAYRVFKKATSLERGEETTRYYVELLDRIDLQEYL